MIILTKEEYTAILAEVMDIDEFDIYWLYKIYVAENNGQTEVADKARRDYDFNWYLRDAGRLN